MGKRRRFCKDCPPGSKRPAAHPGPRCATHHRERSQKVREAAFSRRLWETYRLTAEDYWRLYEAQGGRCAVCQRATGKRKRLAVDHDHSCCPSTPTCGRCTRGLLCASDNKLLGRFRDDPEAFRRGARYLESWPSKGVLP